MVEFAAGRAMTAVPSVAVMAPPRLPEKIAPCPAAMCPGRQAAGSAGLTAFRPWGVAAPPVTGIWTGFLDWLAAPVASIPVPVKSGKVGIGAQTLKSADRIVMVVFPRIA